MGLNLFFSVRTTPDTVDLPIYHGKIINGRKINYEPGDSITVQCYAGYTLVGPSKIRYIGGKRWFPGIPSCSLSMYMISEHVLIPDTLF